MSDLAEFFFSAPARVVLFDCLEISHPNFSRTYRIVRNAPNGLNVTQSEAATEWAFDGVDDEVDFGNVAEADFDITDEFSITGWFRTTTSTTGSIIAKENSGPSFEGWFVAITSGGNLFFRCEGTPSPGTNKLEKTTTAAFDDGNWHSFAITKSTSAGASGVKLYVDDSLQTTTTGFDGLIGSMLNSASLKIGKRGATSPIDASLKHLAIWGKELDASEVSEATGGTEPPDLEATSMWADNVLWVKLDEEDTDGSGGVIDHGPNGLNGTANFDPALVDGPADYEYYPARVVPVASSDDLVQALSITLGDVGDVIAAENERVWEANGWNTRPTLIYRGYRSDDLSAPIRGPIELEVVSVTTSKEGCSIEARAPETNASRTGELYTIERFPMLRGFT